MPLDVGEVFAGYTIVRVLGAGGMGKVYLASHPRLPRQDAVKVLPMDLTADPEFRARFMREAELAAGLSHPHIVAIHDRGEHDGHFWISMDYVAGTDAGELMNEHYPDGMPVDEALPIITAVALALDHAHHRGLLHRDVKPANILLTDPDGQERRIFLADFGIARRIDDAAGLTATNMTVGTVAYAPPEQLKGEAVDGRADQYALACTAFHLLTGAPPYVHSNPAVVITQHVIGHPAPISERRPELAPLDWVFAVAMARKPAGRFGSCAEFAEQLRESLVPGSTSGRRDVAFPRTEPYAITAPTQPPPAVVAGPRRRRGVLIGALVGVALLIAGGVFAVMNFTQHHDPGTPVGPLTGTYRADFGPLMALDQTAADPSATPSTLMSSTYGLRSVCRSTGCVATAARVGGVPIAAANAVLDQIGGSWVGVVLGSDDCQGATVQFWQTFALQPRPDGTLTGVYTTTSNNVCANSRTVTFTRTGDVDDSKVPDPASQPPRVASPAQALYGHYKSAQNFTTGDHQARQADYAVATECLRTGDRCISYLHEPSEDIPLVFGDGKWVWNVEADVECKSGGSTHLKVNAEFPLPQPLQNPITELKGHGHHEQSAPCAMAGDFDETFTRVG